MAGAAIVRTAAESSCREIRVQTITNESAFLALEPVWNQVLEAAAPSHPFLEFAWTRTWWECFGRSGSLRILVLWDVDGPIAVAPLMETVSNLWGLPLRRLGFLYNSHVPRVDFLVSRRHADCYRAIWNHLRGGPWDLLQLCQLPDGSPTMEELAALANQDGYPTGVWASGESPYICLDRGWQDYKQTLTAKHRSNLRNRFKRLTQVGAVEVETITAAEHLSSALDEAFRIEASAWKGTAGTAIQCASSLRRFYTQFAERAAGRCWLRLHFLRAGDRRIAFDYSLCYRNQIFLLKIGYDAAFAPYAPSNLLLHRVLEGAFNDGTARYDFLGEFADWKKIWTKDATPHRWLFVFSRRLRGQVGHFAKFRLIPRLKSCLGRA